MSRKLIPGLSYLLYLRSSLGQSFWFLPGVIMLCGVGFAFLTHWLDQLVGSGAFSLPEGFPEVTLESGREILATVAGSMITVVSLVFSLTLVVLTLAASTMGPRLIETWTENRVNQIALGLFLASFLHALLVLVTVGGENVVPVVSVYVAAVGAAVNSAWLIYFIHSLSRQIRIDNTIADITRQYCAMVSESAGPDEQADERPAFPSARGRARTEVPAPTTGYLQTIDHDALTAFACANDLYIRLQCAPGAYLVSDMPVARVVHPREPEADIAAEVARAFVIGPARTGAQDFEFQIDLLVEVAVRALSPGVNDLYTAIAAIDHLSGCLSETLREGLPPHIAIDEKGAPRVWTQGVTFPRLLNASIKPIRQSAAALAPASICLLDALARVARYTRTRDDKAAISRHVDDVVKAATQTLVSKVEIDEVTACGKRVKASLRN